MDILFNSGWTKARERRLTFHRVNCTMNTNGLFQVVDQIDRQKDMEYLWIHRKIEKDCSRPCLSPWITPRSTSHTTPSKSHCRMSNYALDTHMHWRPTCPKLSSSSTNQFILLLLLPPQLLAKATSLLFYITEGNWFLHQLRSHAKFILFG